MVIVRIQPFVYCAGGKQPLTPKLPGRHLPAHGGPSKGLGMDPELVGHLRQPKRAAWDLRHGRSSRKIAMSSSSTRMSRQSARYHGHGDVTVSHPNRSFPAAISQIP